MKYGKAVNEGGVRDWGAGPVCTSGIGAIDIAPAGNVVLAVGVETSPGSDSWEQITRVTLTPEEWAQLKIEVDAKLLGDEIVTTAAPPGLLG